MDAADNTGALAMNSIDPTATELRSLDDLPFVDLGTGEHFRLLHAEPTTGTWIVQTRFEPGTTLDTHLHTGHVHAFTEAGVWHYLETPDLLNTAGSYLLEPAGARHTLHVPDTNTAPTLVWFTIHGANLTLDTAGNVTLVVDAAGVLALYEALCAAQHGRAPSVVR
jgi:quercetin dioxygenase-like cupin family protein